MKPTQILAKLCKEAKLDPPVYLNGTVKIGTKTFCLQNNIDDTIEWYCSKGKLNILCYKMKYNLLQTFNKMNCFRYGRTHGVSRLAQLARNTSKGLSPCTRTY